MSERRAFGSEIEPPSTLIVLARAPRFGAGKQRLAGDTGRVEAWRINRFLQARTLVKARDPRWRIVLCVAPRGAERLDLPRVWPRDCVRVAQGEGDLGARLARVLLRRRNVAVIGTDAPEISRALIAAAFDALKRAPFALGPAVDGGFWLLAARSGRAAAKAMENVRWSSAFAAADVARNLNAKVARLPVLRDVDTLSDWRAWSQRSATRASSAS